MSALEGLTAEYSPSMTKPVLHAWARRIVAAINGGAAVGKVSVDLADLVGLRKLDAVDFSTEVRGKLFAEDYEQSQACRFRLNGVVYVAIEDPSDGYRSSMGELFIQNDAVLCNVFPSVDVVGVHRTKHGYESCDIVELIDVVTGKVVLEIGTTNTSDYYPSFVASFSPENMATNAGAEKLSA